MFRSISTIEDDDGRSYMVQKIRRCFKFGFLIFGIVFLSRCSTTTNINNRDKGQSGFRSRKEVLRKITGELKRTWQTRTVRLAVRTFMPTETRYRFPNDFGKYFSESLITALKQNLNVRLFERSRLDAVLREHKFTVSDMVSATEAKRIGALLPIDYIFTGTYTVFKDHVEINGRVINVVTGEIVATFHDRIALSGDMSGMFKKQAKTKSDVSVCASIEARMNVFLTDLRTKEKINAAADYAASVPFDNECGKVHFTVIRRFRNFKLYPKGYVNFLVRTLHTIQRPYADRRVRTILQYLHSDGEISDAEWEAGCAAARRNSRYYTSAYLKYLFHSNTKDQKYVSRQQKRIDQYMAYALQGKVGMPVPLSVDQAYVAMMYGLLYENKRVPGGLAYDCLEKYQKTFKTPDFLPMHRMLTDYYKNEKDLKHLKQLMGYIIVNCNASLNERATGDSMYSFAMYLANRIKDKNLKAAQKNGHSELFETYKRQCRLKIADTFPLIQRNRYRRGGYVLTAFCIRHHIHCPKLVPTIEQMRQSLKLRDHRALRPHLILVEALGERARPLENDVYDLLVWAEKKRRTSWTGTAYYCLVILGHIKPTDIKKREMILRMAVENRNGGIEAIQGIGEPMVKYLVQKLNTHNTTRLLEVVKILSHLEEKARNALPALRRLQKKHGNRYVRSRIAVAIRKIE